MNIKDLKVCQKTTRILLKRLRNLSRNINKNPNVIRFYMSRRRRKTNDKANNSNLVGLVATVIKEGDKNRGKRVLIQEVNNDIAKVLLLDDDEMNKFYLPISDLRIFSRERSIECLLENIIDGLRMDVDNKAINGDEDWRKHARRRSNADNEPIFEEPKDDHEEDSERNYSNHVLEGGDLIVKCSKFCRDYKVSPIYFISKLSEHLYFMHERYAPKNEK